MPESDVQKLIDGLTVQLERNDDEKPGILPVCYVCGLMTLPQFGHACAREDCGLRILGERQG